MLLYLCITKVSLFLTEEFPDTIPKIDVALVKATTIILSPQVVGAGMTSLDLNSTVDLISNSGKPFDVNKITAAFRFLRNLCGTNPECQNSIIRDLNILTSTKEIFLDVLANENANAEQILCLQVGMQFLGNLIVNNKHSQQQIWLHFRDTLEICLKSKDEKVQNFCCMILYNVFLGNPELLNELTHPFEDIYQLTVNENSSEFAVFILEIFVLNSNYLLKYYDELKPESRIIILEVVKSLITEQSNKILQSEIINFFSKQFTKKSDLILKTSEKYADTLDTVEVVKLLDLLVAFSSDDKLNYLEIIQNENSLLINCIALLKNLHTLSKQTGNNFSMITKISEMEEVEKITSVQEHPVFGFKCSLIRLIGNFCWKNATNQNHIRKLECIPVLLDCCNIDARNPFIIQWCILAIRNICEKNVENQKVIASLSKEGVIDSARLQELGITLNSSENGETICIAPLK